MSPLTRAEIRQRAASEAVITRARMYAVARQVLQDRADAPALPDDPTPAEQQAAIKAALELANAQRTPRAGVVDYARQTLRETTEFVRAKNFVTVPDEPVEIILMPEFQRGVAVAYCDSPGPARQRPAHVLCRLADSRGMDRCAGRIVPARVQHALDREPDDSRGDAGPLPAARPFEPLSVDAARDARLGSVHRRLGGLCRARHAGAGLSRRRPADAAGAAQVVPALDHQRHHGFRDPCRWHAAGRGDAAHGRDRLPGRARGCRQVGSRAAHFSATVDVLRRLPGARRPARRQPNVARAASSTSRLTTTRCLSFGSPPVRLVRALVFDEPIH